MADDPHNKQTLETELAVLKNELKNLKEIIRELKESNQTKTDKLEAVESRIEIAVNEVIDLVADKYVTKIEWTPYKQVVFGLVAFVLIAALGALLSLVIKKS
jgi:chromosome segregation ATPase